MSMYFMYAVVARLIARYLTLSQRKLWPLMVHEHNHYRALLLLGRYRRSQHMRRGNIALPPLRSSPELRCHRYIPTRTVSRNSSPITGRTYTVIYGAFVTSGGLRYCPTRSFLELSTFVRFPAATLRHQHGRLARCLGYHTR
jgi:hypothetical protein